MPIVSPNKQQQSTEGQYCPSLWTACCQHAAAMGHKLYWLCALSFPPASREQWSISYETISIPDLETACCHYAITVNQAQCCGNMNQLTAKKQVRCLHYIPPCQSNLEGLKLSNTWNNWHTLCNQRSHMAPEITDMGLYEYVGVKCQYSM